MALPWAPDKTALIPAIKGKAICGISDRKKLSTSLRVEL
jgi:hypothetical protein